MDNPRWFFERQTAQEEIIDQTEDGSIQSNPEREGNHRNRSECR
jgi:hypothetical protein